MQTSFLRYMPSNSQCNSEVLVAALSLAVEPTVLRIQAASPRLRDSWVEMAQESILDLVTRGLVTAEV